MTPYYQDDIVTLYHGDCREIDTWLKADVLVTDPPYGVRWGSHHGDRRRPERVLRTRDVIEGDRSPQARDEMLELWGNAKPGVVFGSWRIDRPRGTRAVLVWNKDGCYSALSRSPFFTVHEEIYIVGDGWSLDGDRLPLRSVLTTSEHRSAHTAAVGHPTPKPVELMRRLVERTDGVVADPFAGSGSTLRAAKDLGRKAIGVEIEERYCEIAARRLSQEVLPFGEAV